MVELTLEQKKAMALAAARLRMQQSAPLSAAPGAPLTAPQGMPAGAMAELSALSTPGNGTAPTPEWMAFDRANPDVPEWAALDRSQPPPQSGTTLRGPGRYDGAFMVQDPRLSSSRTLVDGLSNGMTFGWGDEMQAAVRAPFSDRTYGDIRDELQDRKALGAELYPDANAAGNIVGGLAAPTLGAGKLIAAAPGWLLKTLAGAGTGALTGALYGAGNAEEGERGQQALVGGVTGGLSGGVISALLAGGSSLVNSYLGKKAVAEAGEGAPSPDELRKWAADQYADMRASGAVIPQNQFPISQIGQDLQAGALDTRKLGGVTDTPLGERLMLGAEDLATDPKYAAGIGPDDLMALRSRASETAADLNPTTKMPTRDAKVGQAGLTSIDDLLETLVGSQGKDAAKAWGKSIRAEKIAQAVDAGENYLSGATSGIRNQLKALLKNPKTLKGYSPGEIDAIRRVINGGPIEEVVRMAGGGLGRLLSAGGGAAGGGLPGAAAGYALATGARDVSDAMTKANAAALIKAITSGKLESVPGVSQGAVAKIIAALQRTTATTRELEN